MSKDLQDLEDKLTEVQEETTANMDTLKDAVDDLDNLIATIDAHLEKSRNKTTEELKKAVTDIALARRRERRKNLIFQVCIAILVGMGFSLLSFLLA